jgi:hypothetical protein
MASEQRECGHLVRKKRSPRPFTPRDDTGIITFIIVKEGAYKQMESLESIAKMIDHSLLHPSMTDEELKAGCVLDRGF